MKYNRRSFKTFFVNLNFMTMKNLLLILLLFISNLSFSITCTSLGSSSWNNPSNWSCGAVPSPGDTIVIGVGHTVTISLNIDLNGAPVVVVVNGVLLFDSPGAKLRLECGSSVVVTPTGEIRDSGNGTSSHSIRICGNDVWTGSTGSVFGPTVITGVTPLSIDLIEFTVNPNRNQLEFKWFTASEVNNSFFTIESSADNFNWVAINTTKGAGNSNEKLNYKVDLKNEFNHEYFRLRQTDFDGTSTLSKVVSISNSLNDYELLVSPNPLNDGYLRIYTNMKNYDVRIISLSGVVIQELYSQNEGTLELIDLQLDRGVYIVQLFGDNTILSERVIKN